METQSLTIELPEPIFQQRVAIAEVTQQRVETLVAQSVLSNLPPTSENSDPELRSQLLQMQTLAIEELLAIAESEGDRNTYSHHLELLAKNAEGNLTPDEQEELARLRQEADALVLRKAYAWRVLRWRGYRVPPLGVNPNWKCNGLGAAFE